MKNRIVAGAGAAVIVLAAVGWYLFRPELLFVDQHVSEAFPAAPSATGSGQAQPLFANALVTGKFKGYAHETEGAATVFEVDGRRVLRLTNFKTSNGPDVRVYLVAASDVMDDATVRRAGYIDLGTMKGNVGDQNYEVPSGTDLAKYRAVTIWCERFSVNFGTAPLTAAS